VRSLFWVSGTRERRGGKSFRRRVKRIGRDDGDDLNDVWIESERALFADESKLSKAILIVKFQRSTFGCSSLMSGRTSARTTVPRSR
jgi:hypothetical protein